ncbi:CAP domain-containing protein [Hoeflea sp.]|uniref:CAP domain-containing protein n=1 Tax=Hoeflea sp. TaxID=1940281 RepID=UPI0019B21368|nr:CAP domain-containing protein [Hoeflea sp.]MBC7283076.1 CAP domain-containing protein [Hoeflea sp.]
MIAHLTVFLALILLAAPASAQAPDDIDALRARSLSLVNKDRRAEGLGRLELEDTLNQAALAHARDMLERGYFSHTSPEGGTVLDRYRKAGGGDGRVVRENISRCTGCREQPDTSAVDDMHKGWMNSPGHRANILAEGLNGYGFAVVQDSRGNRYGVETFAGPGAPRGEVPGGKVEAIGPQAQTELAAAIINGERSGSSRVSADARLRGHLEAKLAAVDPAAVGLSQIRLHDDLPPGLDWRDYQVLYGECGGCGAEPTNSDVYFFVGKWSESRRSRAILKDGSLGNIGFVIAADGQGRKIAVLLLAGQ